ncbi:winged helix-turn-helix transcriptional regulator [Sulfolobus acidocaldarius]|uniref:Conserved protein n=5 Tax=Sulfolobus acidocaldarius TaxID=2285 RepID=Q4J8B3_SULAC|nr:winged helix-turn-helix transcriptional regulator [Sulfolobus acidocaldarius]AAY80968.1 conserved protein [Sulfolobus acidocaldarius DSM 639]AGE71569.1 hypothetical protein SacN8_08045 [Sulfolobus acidocaldarius N8]AGE73842.1 hypothetical protein SacRon12I_08055 [Sulfolobus acidocaldarius Ron12/I]ALU30648.1 hypothetical protein ATY89_09830 [Sulfolobus acidocaldarius]ALU32740.1 hypothetical protein ATZ20_01385 [Sulfolobus acidocaldarius]
MMDSIDKKILIYLFRDGRISQRKIAEEVKLSATSLNYRFNKLIEDGIIKSFKVQVNPNLYGKYYGFVSFKNYKDLDFQFIDLKVNCLEDLNVYRLVGDSTEDIEDKISVMSKDLGEPQMSYIPPQNPIIPSGIDIKIVKSVIKNPRIEISEIAKDLNLPSKSVNRRINVLTNKNMIRIYPIVDLSKADLIMFAIFSSHIDSLDFLKTCSFTSFKDNGRGIVICITENIRTAENYFKNVRDIDREAEIMVTTSYDIRNEGALRELERIESQTYSKAF